MFLIEKFVANQDKNTLCLYPFFGTKKYLRRIKYLRAYEEISPLEAAGRIHCLLGLVGLGLVAAKINPVRYLVSAVLWSFYNLRVRLLSKSQ